MGDFSLDTVLNVIKNATAAVKVANDAIDQFRDSKVVFTTGTTEEEVDAAISALKKEYDELHVRVQNKLRGTNGS